MRKKGIAGLFALILGFAGMHWFYLGKRMRGILYFAATTLLIIITANAEGPVFLIMALVVLIDALLLFSMPREEFDEKYNPRMQGHRSQFQNLKMNPPAKPEKIQGDPWKAAGVEKFRDYDFEGAIEDFKKALANKYEDPAVHFNLACCYSLLEKSSPAFFHLGKAVQHGFVDFDKIEKHDGLAFLRTLPEFKDFAKNGYQHRALLPLPEENLLQQKPNQTESHQEENLLDQIKRLSELRNQGILTQDEFISQTRQVLKK